MSTIAHNPDQYMSDLRHVLAQGKKRIGFLVGAGAPASLPSAGEPPRPLIPMVDALTAEVLNKLTSQENELVGKVRADLGDKVDIECLLTRVRTLAKVAGKSGIYGSPADSLQNLSDTICRHIGEIVKVDLPPSPCAYTSLAEWIGGARREHPIEIFTTNYDFLFETAFERSRVPYFDGFVGSREPFFEPASVTGDQLTSRWVRLWKLHGSLGWSKNKRGDYVRGKGTEATSLIYPTDAKYEETRKLPYLAYLDRMRHFLSGPDSLLIVAGFSFKDAHIKDTLSESIATSGASILALLYGHLAEYPEVVSLATTHDNVSAYARDQAVIGCVRAGWRPGDPPHTNWDAIRSTYWRKENEHAPGHFLLGDFASFCRYVSLSRARVAGPDKNQGVEKSA